MCQSFWKKCTISASAMLPSPEVSSGWPIEWLMGELEFPLVYRSAGASSRKSAVKGEKRISFGGENIPPRNVCLPVVNIYGVRWRSCSSSSLLLLLLLLKKRNVMQLQTFSGMSGQTAAPLVPSHRLNLKRRSHFPGTPLEIVESRSGASSCDCNASQTSHNNSQLEKLPLTSSNTHRLTL